MISYLFTWKLLTHMCRTIQMNLDMTDSMGPGKLVRHMQNPSYTYDKNPSYSGASYPSSPVEGILKDYYENN